MDAKEYLEQIGKLQRKINAMKLRSEEYERLSMSIPGPNYDRPIVDGTRSLEAPFVKWLMKKDEIDREIAKLEIKLKELQGEAILKIEEIENEDYKNLLVLRYISLLNWDEIASKLFVVKRTIMRWHELALSELKI